MKDLKKTSSFLIFSVMVVATIISPLTVPLFLHKRLNSSTQRTGSRFLLLKFAAVVAMAHDAKITSQSTWKCLQLERDWNAAFVRSSCLCTITIPMFSRLYIRCGQTMLVEADRHLVSPTKIRVVQKTLSTF